MTKSLLDIVAERYAEKTVYLKCSKNGMLDGICKGYSDKYIAEKKARGYIEISKEKYDEIMSKNLAINYDYE